MPASPTSRWLRPALLACALVSSPLLAADNLPPRAQWQVSASSRQVAALAPQHAIDADETTRWGGAFSPGHWLQLDLGREAAVGGVRIHWDSGFAVGYRIQASRNGKDWEDVYTSTDSRGATDYLFFPTRQARYLRLASPERTADWGVSVFEFEPLGPSAARLSAAGNDAARVWEGRGEPLTLPQAQGKAQALEINLPRADAVAGLEVWWDGPRHGARLEARDAAGHWRSVADDPGSAGDLSFLAAREAFKPTALRLVAGLEGAAPRIRRLRLLGPEQVLTATKRMEILASREHAALFPAQLHRQQIYWTVVGVPAGRQKSIFDEFGNLEAFKGAPMLQAIWRDDQGAVSADGVARTQSLREGWMPMPTVQWQARPQLSIRNEAMAIEQRDGQPVTLVRYRIENTGTVPSEGALTLLVRPIQVNPPWQHGGVSAIERIAVEGDAVATDVRVNDRVLLSALTPVDARGAAGFGRHGEDEPTALVARGQVPPAQQARDEDGLASAVLSWRVAVAPGAHRDIVVALPLGTQPRDAAGVLPPAPPVDRSGWQGDAGQAFDAAADTLAGQWRQRFGNIGLQLPDASLVDMLRAQGAYMLINQTGPAMQPGPRNYNRSFIRDGAATASALLRMGQPRVARDYLRWYSDHAVHENGLVSPILNEDGSVNRGFGSDIEYDSQGEYINLVADVARLDGGPESVRDYLPKVIAAMRFMQELRERTLVPGYMADQPAPERFAGIIAPSISHEGYSSPTHSYWDDYWALKGWHDGAWLAEQLGDEATAEWARAQYQLLRDSVAASIRATIAWKHGEVIPASADLGDGDPTSVSIALDPTGQQALLPETELRTTFDRYMADVRAREQPDALFAYTPYEMRNVLTYVHLDRVDEAQELLSLLMEHRRPLPWHVLAEVVHSRLRYPGYLGDMPHTWIGAEYARTLYGMLMREEDDALLLLPGTPVSWLAGDGVAIDALPTAYGTLGLKARETDGVLKLELAPGLRADTAVQVSWPSRQRPREVRVDGRKVKDYDARGIRLARPFRTLEARW
ncbi:MAG TPA: discoidin domain-containing protein [Stenotrophomonas sp.]|nr:discoidin domain-containing protein [Stenotrophomonas sp.]